MDNQHKYITGYRDLSQKEIDMMNILKEKGNEIGNLLETMKLDVSLDQRCVAIACTEMQTAFMWAIRAIAQPTSF